MQHPKTTNFGTQIALLGYDLAPAEPELGNTLRLTLYWQAQAEIEQDYTVFIHLLDTEGRLVAQHDSQPEGGRLPTSSWASVLEPDRFGSA